MLWTEVDIRAACLKVRNGGGVRKATDKFKILYSTLSEALHSLDLVELMGVATA